MNKVFALCLIFLLSACSATSSASADSLTSGVKGQVLIGPTCPVVRADNPCPNEPYQAVLTILDLSGREVKRFETDADGKFQVVLPLGDYILHPENPDGLPVPSAADVPFTVVPNGFTNIIVTFDSGIR